MLFNDKFHIVIDENVIEGHISCSDIGLVMTYVILGGRSKNQSLAESSKNYPPILPHIGHLSKPSTIIYHT
jgi:hypothetical protein